MEVIDIYNVPKYAYVIYKIVSPSGRVYIGSTKNLHKRFKSYREVTCKAQTKLYHSLLKYGVDAHKFEVIEFVKETDKLLDRENYWGFYFNCLDVDKGMNLRLPKVGSEPTVISEETRQLLRERCKRFGEENGFYGKKHKESSKRYGKDNHMYGVQRFGADNPASKLVLDMETGVYFDSVVEASDAYGFNRSTLSDWLTRAKHKNRTNLRRV